jgi:hypothetical protein
MLARKRKVRSSTDRSGSIKMRRQLGANATSRKGGSDGNEPSLRAAAALMVQHHGLDALRQATERTQELSTVGDADERASWLRMIVLIAQLLDDKNPSRLLGTAAPSEQRVASHVTS